MDHPFCPTVRIHQTHPTCPTPTQKWITRFVSQLVSTKPTLSALNYPNNGPPILSQSSHPQNSPYLHLHKIPVTAIQKLVSRQKAVH